MPIYEYSCQKCGAQMEVMQKISDKPLARHGKCGGKLVKEWSQTSFQLKGTGWYVTDYAGKKGEPKEAKETKDAKDTKEPSKAEKETTKSAAAESKSATAADKPATAAADKKAAKPSGPPAKGGD